MKKTLILFLAGCLMIGIGAGVTAFEVTTYEIVQRPIAHNNKAEFTIDLEKEARLVLPGWRDVRYIEDGTLSGKAKIVIQYRGNDGDLQIEKEAYGDGEGDEDVYYLIDRDTDRTLQEGNRFREWMKELRERKIMIWDYDDPMSVMVYINPGDREKFVMD